MGIGPREWDGNGNCHRTGNGNGNLEGMGVDCMGIGGNGNVKSHSRTSLVCGATVAPP